MGRRGPQKTPTAILKLRGSMLPKYNRKNEPVAEGLPVKPDFLIGAAGDMFDKLVIKLDRMGILGEVDENSLAIYCKLWELYWQAVEDIEKHGCSIKLVNNKGKKYLRERPTAKTLISLASQLSRYAAGFGMFPAARAGLQVRPKDEADNLESLINRQKKNAG